MGIETLDGILEQGGPLQRWDGRTKTFLSLMAVLVAVGASRPRTDFLILAGCLLLLRYGRLPLRDYRVRLGIPFGIAWLVLLSQALLQGGAVLWRAPPPLAFLALHREGLREGYLLALRVLASVSVVTILSFTTPLPEILASLRYLRLPPFVLDLSLLIHRYVFVLSDELRRLRLARASRLVATGRLAAAWGLGQLGGMVFLRAAERGVRVHQAMLARLYDEESHLADYYRGRSLTAEDLRRLAVGLVGLAVLFLADRLPTVGGWF